MRPFLNLKIRKTLFTFFLLAAPCVAFQAATGQWIRFNSEPGGFSLLMPGPDAPKDEPETITDPIIGPYTTHLYMQRTDKGIFLAGWVDYAPNTRLNVPAEIAANRDHFLKHINAKLISQHDITLDGNPGIDFTAEQEKGMLRGRVYVVGQRPYMTIALTFKQFDDAANVQRFLDSFQLKKP